MSILLIRHGETALNVARVLQPADTPLSARGQLQAQALAQRLGALGVTAILSSDLPRALQTAQAIAAVSGAPIETSALLHERNFGDFRGLSYDDMGVNPLTMLDAPPNGESAEAFAQRVALAFGMIVQRRKWLADPRGGTLAVVTHGLVLRTLFAAQLRLPDGTPAPSHFGNTSLSVLDADAPHRVTLLDCTRHLEGGARDDAKALSGG